MIAPNDLIDTDLPPSRPRLPSPLLPTERVEVRQDDRTNALDMPLLHGVEKAYHRSADIEGGNKVAIRFDDLWHGVHSQTLSGPSSIRITLAISGGRRATDS